MGRNRIYTDDHLDFLRAGYQSMNVRDLTIAFNQKFGTEKTESMIQYTLQRYGIRCGRKQSERFVKRPRIYTKEHEEFVKEYCPHVTKKRLVELFNEQFGMDLTISKMKAFFSNRKIQSGKTGYFPKGHTPWNNGTKGQGLTGANKTSFRKGSVPGNRKPMWSERIDRKNGYIMIKVPEIDPYMGFPTRYKPKHVWLWEQKNGPVPPGNVIIFLDGDRRNFDDDNLKRVSRSVLVRMNQLGFGNASKELKPSIVALAQLKAKTGVAARKFLSAGFPFSRE